MKLPRYSLRTLLIAITVFAVWLGWVDYQLNWIRQRHRFLAEKQIGRVTMIGHPHGYVPPDCPLSLRIFGERRCKAIVVAQEDEAEARSLFPEAEVSHLPLMPSH